jgi:hypothetical protein
LNAVQPFLRVAASFVLFPDVAWLSLPTDEVKTKDPALRRGWGEVLGLALFFLFEYRSR